MGLLQRYQAGLGALDSHLQLPLLADLDVEDGDSLIMDSLPLPTAKKSVVKKRKKREGKFLDSSTHQMTLSWDALFESTMAPDGAQTVEDLQSWTEDEIEHLHNYLLEQSLSQALNPRSSMATRIDVLGWVDQITPYKQKALPLSFDACCHLSGYNPEEMREHLHEEMKFRGIHPTQ